MTAAMPPMNSETGFLKIRQETDEGLAKAGSPFGLLKSAAGRPPGSRSEREALSSRRASSPGSGSGFRAVASSMTALRMANALHWDDAGLSCLHWFLQHP